MNIKAMALLLFVASLHGMETPAGRYFGGWDAMPIPTYIEPSDMMEAIGHGLWLAHELDKSSSKKLKYDRDQAKKDAQRYGRVFVKACQRIEDKDQEIYRLQLKIKAMICSILIYGMYRIINFISCKDNDVSQETT